MERLPEGFKTENYKDKIVPIKGFSNESMYDWGRNCRIMYKDDKTVPNQLMGNIDCIDSDKFDSFWEGYYYGIEQVIK